MGLLDDAIREHLELRRRLGADASEVARLEQEALGPVVRGELAGSHGGEVQFDPDGQLVEGVSEHQLDIHDAIDVPPADRQPGQEEELPVAHDDDDVGDGPGSAEEHVPPVVAEAVEVAYVPPPAAGQETEEFDVEAGHSPAEPEPSAELAEPAGPAVLHWPPSTDAPFADAPPAESPPSSSDHPPPEPEEPAPAEEAVGDDVLEQTPEFLQETPEHDRLWFEQAPPKDFDFDR